MWGGKQTRLPPGTKKHCGRGVQRRRWSSAYDSGKTQKRQVLTGPRGPHALRERRTCDARGSPIGEARREKRATRSKSVPFRRGHWGRKRQPVSVVSCPILFTLPVSVATHNPGAKTLAPDVRRAEATIGRSKSRSTRKSRKSKKVLALNFLIFRRESEQIGTRPSNGARTRCLTVFNPI